MPPALLPVRYRYIPSDRIRERGGRWKPSAPTDGSSGQHRTDLTILPLSGGVCFRHRPSVTIPIWRVVRLHAVRELIPGHDVSGTGWQTLGGAMQSITTMMPM